MLVGGGMPCARVDLVSRLPWRETPPTPPPRRGGWVGLAPHPGVFLSFRHDSYVQLEASALTAPGAVPRDARVSCPRGGSGGGDTADGGRALTGDLPEEDRPKRLESL